MSDAFSFNTGKMIERVIKDQTDNLELTNRNLQALILDYRHCIIEDPIQREYYEKYFNIQTVAIESENKTMETVKEVKSAEAEWKSAVNKAATAFVQGHKDEDVRLMFGYHFRTFVEGAIWQQSYASIQTSELKAENERLREHNQMLQRELHP